MMCTHIIRVFDYMRRHLLESREQSPGPLVDDGRNAHAHSVVGVGNHEEPLPPHCEEPSPAVLSTSFMAGKMVSNTISSGHHTVAHHC